MYLRGSSKEILRFLPLTHCRECGEATCMVFAATVAQGIKGLEEDCSQLLEEDSRKLQNHIDPFHLDD